MATRHPYEPAAPAPTPQSDFVPPEYPYRLYHISSRPDALVSSVVADEAAVTDLGEGWGAAAELPFETAPDGPPAPVLVTLVPESVTLGQPSFTVHVTGAGFVTGSVIVFNGFEEPTTVAGPHDLTTVVNMDVWQAPAEVPVWVRNPDGQESAPQPFTFLEVPAQDTQTWHGARTGRSARTTAGQKERSMAQDTPKTPPPPPQPTQQPAPPSPKPGPEGGREPSRPGGDREGPGRDREDSEGGHPARKS